MPSVTEEELARLEELCEKAVKPPYYLLPPFPKSIDDHGYRLLAIPTCGDGLGLFGLKENVVGDGPVGSSKAVQARREATWEMWTQAPEALPRLIAEVRRLKGMEAAVVRYAEADTAVQKMFDEGATPFSAPTVDRLHETRDEVLRLGKEARHE